MITPLKYQVIEIIMENGVIAFKEQKLDLYVLGDDALIS